MISLREMCTDVLASSKREHTMREVAEMVAEKYPERLQYKIQMKNGNEEAGFKQLLQEVKQNLITNTEVFYINKNMKPYTVGLIEKIEIEDEVFTDDEEDYESDTGIVYILGTNTFTKDGKELIKIGFTTQEIDKRLNQLYTTGVPFEFRIIQEYKVRNYVHLEKALHSLLDNFRPNKAREFFTNDCIDYIDQIANLNTTIQTNDT